MTRRTRSLAAKLGVFGSTLLVLALASIGLTLWVTWQLEGGAAAVNEAGRMRMQTWRLAQTLAGDDRSALPAQLRQFEASLRLLRTDDPSRPLFVPRDAGTRASFAEVEAEWMALREGWTGDDLPRPREAARQATAFVDRIDAFVSAIESELARWTAMLQLVQLAMTALAVGSAVALLYAAYIFVLDPLARLQRGLARVEQADFGARVDVVSHDEFGALGSGFNRMAATLQDMVQQLEDRVIEKTALLQSQRERLVALHEVSVVVGRADSLEELASGFAQAVRRVAQADAVAVRWSDEANQRYVLLASDCLPQQMVEDEHCLPTGACACGQAVGQAATRVIPIVADSPVYPQEHCLRAGYETLIGVPVTLHGRMLGEIDIFFRHAATLGEEDRSLFDTLASHLAGAMESLRTGALEREAAVAEERGLLARELHDSIAQSLAFLKIQVQLLHDGLRRGDAPQIERVAAELDTGVRESIGDVRELLVHFRTRTNAEDITPALQTTLRKFEHQSGLASHLSVQGQGLPLAPDVQVQVLHVVQEALSNVRKHAQASQVWVEVAQTPQWRVTVRDDGRGFSAGEHASDETHVGLRIMRERATRIGARVQVTSTPGGGTQVVLTLAAREQEAQAA